MFNLMNSTGPSVATTSLPLADFGRTGHRSTRVIFGAAALGGMSQARADATIATVAEAGINHFDTAASYGESELRLAPWLAVHRSEIFLATKTGERSGAAARAELERSLERLGVDQIDLVQLHNLVESDEFDVAHGPGGAVEALAAARDEGLVRFIGVTGHGTRIPAMHSASLERFDFDSVLLPFNFTMMEQPAYRADVEQLLTTCAERSVAVQTIKALAKGRWAPNHDGPKFSWYEPITDPDALARAVAYVLANEQVFLNTTSDARLLPQIVAAATAGHRAPSREQMEADTLGQGITPLFDPGDLERI